MAAITGTIDYGPGGPAMSASSGPSSYGTISSDGGLQSGNELNKQLSQYTVHPGDSLSHIAQMFGTDWQTLYGLNKGIIGGNPNLIQPNQILQIPGNQNGPNGPGGPQSLNPPTGSLTGTMNGTNPGPSITGSTSFPVPPAPTNNGGNQNTPLPPAGQNGQPAFNLAGQSNQFAYTPEQQGYLNSITSSQNQLQGLISMVDLNYNQQLASINAEMENQKIIQSRENAAYNAGVEKEGAAAGLDRFTPEILGANVKAAVNSGIQKITEITMKQQDLIRQASSANLTQKMDILKELHSLDTEKFTAAETMKKDFFANLLSQQEIEKNTINAKMGSIYDEIRALPEGERNTRFLQKAQELGVSSDALRSAYRSFDRTENQAITDAWAQVAAKYPDSGLTTADIYNPDPKVRLAKLQSSQIYRNDQLLQHADIALKQAQARNLLSTSAVYPSGRTYNVPQQKEIDSILKDLSNNKLYQSVQQVDSYKNVIDSAYEQSTNLATKGMSDFLLADSFYKLANPGSNRATQPATLKIIADSRSFIQNLGTRLGNLQAGSKLSQGQRDQIKSLAAKISSNELNQWNTSMALPYINRAMSRNIDPHDIGLYLGQGTYQGTTQQTGLLDSLYTHIYGQ